MTTEHRRRCDSLQDALGYGGCAARIPGLGEGIFGPSFIQTPLLGLVNRTYFFQQLLHVASASTTKAVEIVFVGIDKKRIVTIVMKRALAHEFFLIHCLFNVAKILL